MTDKHTVLYVDDESENLVVFREAFRRQYMVLTADSGEGALELLQSEPVHIIVCDQRMPGMAGTDVLKVVSEQQPQIVRIMLTAYTDVEQIIEAVNEGKIFQYVTKPWEEAALGAVLMHAAETYDLRQALIEKQAQLTRKNQELVALNNKIRKSFLDSIAVFFNILGLTDPSLAAHSKRVAELCLAVLNIVKIESLSNSQVWAAGLLHDVGAVGIPRQIIGKFEAQGEAATGDPEYDVYASHPGLGMEVLSVMEGLERAARFVLHHHERMDGKGFPKGLKGEDIPLGARIIAVCDAYDHLTHIAYRDRPRPELAAIGHLRNEAGRWVDPRFLDALVKHLEGRQDRTKSLKQISKDELKTGMVVAADIRTDKGVVLLPAEAEVTKQILIKIKSFDRIDPIASDILVYE